MKQQWKENFRRNWEHIPGFGAIFSALVGVLAVALFIAFIWIIGNYPWTLIILLFAAFAITIGLGVYKHFDKKIKGGTFYKL